MFTEATAAPLSTSRLRSIWLRRGALPAAAARCAGQFPRLSATAGSARAASSAVTVSPCLRKVAKKSGVAPSLLRASTAEPPAMSASSVGVAPASAA